MGSWEHTGNRATPEEIANAAARLDAAEKNIAQESNRAAQQELTAAQEAYVQAAGFGKKPQRHAERVEGSRASAGRSER